MNVETSDNEQGRIHDHQPPSAFSLADEWEDRTQGRNCSQNAAPEVTVVVVVLGSRPWELVKDVHEVHEVHSPPERPTRWPHFLLIIIVFCYFMVTQSIWQLFNSLSHTSCRSSSWRTAHGWLDGWDVILGLCRATPQ